MVEFAPARPTRTFEVISGQIREQVRTGALKSGDKLPPERELATQFETSRNAVREALRSLEHAGLIELQKGAHGGAFITDGNPVAVAQSMQDLFHLGGLTLSDITQARLLFEGAVIRAAIAVAGEADFSRLAENVDAVERLTRRGDMDAKAEFNIEFHVILAESTGNRVLVLIMRMLMDLLIAVHRPVTAEDTEDIIQSRRRFLAHLRSRDTDAAVAEMSGHLTRLHDLFATE